MNSPIITREASSSNLWNQMQRPIAKHWEEFQELEEEDEEDQEEEEEEEE